MRISSSGAILINSRWTSSRPSDIPFLYFFIHNRFSCSVIGTFKSSLSSFIVKKFCWVSDALFRYLEWSYTLDLSTGILLCFLESFLKKNEIFFGLSSFFCRRSSLLTDSHITFFCSKSKFFSLAAVLSRKCLTFHSLQVIFYGISAVGFCTHYQTNCCVVRMLVHFFILQRQRTWHCRVAFLSARHYLYLLPHLFAVCLRIRFEFPKNPLFSSVAKILFSSFHSRRASFEFDREEIRPSAILSCIQIRVLQSSEHETKMRQNFSQRSSELSQNSCAQRESNHYYFLNYVLLTCTLRYVCFPRFCYSVWQFLLFYTGQLKA